MTSYIAKFGDRCTQELKLESITLDDDPRPLLAAIAAAARQHAADPATSRPRPTSSTHCSQAGRSSGSCAGLLLGWAKARVRDRENLRFERTRMFGRARRVFLAIGRQLHALDLLDAPRDVFFLTVPEVLGSIEGFALDRDLKALARCARRSCGRRSSADPPSASPFAGRW